jgi:hypothetical protein
MISCFQYSVGFLSQKNDFIHKSDDFGHLVIRHERSELYAVKLGHFVPFIVKSMFGKCPYIDFIPVKYIIS